MRRARDPEHPLRQKRDPYDREANYRRPIPASDIVRIAIKAVVIVGAGVWFKFASDDKTHEGAKLALAAGVALTVAGIVDLVYLRFGEIDQMFLQTRSGQVAARWVMVAVGVGTCIAATVAYAR